MSTLRNRIRRFVCWLIGHDEARDAQDYFWCRYCGKYLGGV